MNRMPCNGTEPAAPALELVPVALVDAVWPRIAAGMEAACRRSGDDLTAPYLFAECRAGRALLFVVTADGEARAALVARVEQWGAARVLRLLAASGRGMGDWLAAVTSHHQWPRLLGCEKVVFEGRRGWSACCRTQGSFAKPTKWI